MSDPHLGRRLALGAALATFAIALSPPVDGRAASSLTTHMVQHVLLLVVIPPLLVAAFPPAARPGRIGGAVAALVAQSAVMWAWHAPAPYDAADRVLAVHIVEHLSFVAAGFAFWWTIRSPRAGAALLLFFAALPGTLLGAAMALAGHPWYAAYPRLADQQLAGVVMWGFASIVYVVAAGVLFARWVAASDAAPVLEVPA